jgi:hypothetical protein
VGLFGSSAFVELHDGVLRCASVRDLRADSGHHL